MECVLCADGMSEWPFVHGVGCVPAQEILKKSMLDSDTDECESHEEDWEKGKRVSPVVADGSHACHRKVLR